MTGQGFVCLGDGMNTRLLVAFIISLCIHILVLLQPWQIMARTELLLPIDDAVPIQLVEELPDEPAQPPEPEPELEVPPEGVSFEAEGVVSDDYMERLKSKIFHAWQYPRKAIDRGEEGSVRLYFELDDQGTLIAIGILTSSGSLALDTAAIKAVEQASPFGPFTEDLTARTLKITGWFSYVLD